MKSPLKVILSVLGWITCFSAIAVGILIYSVIPREYETTNIKDYGHYIGNYDNESVQEIITSFFPKKIENYFSNIAYSYRAQKNDTYGFEANLAFSIEDTNLYNAFLEEHTSGMEPTEFRYDNAYQEYILSDEFQLSTIYEPYISIQRARICKILSNPEKQEIIFIALGVYDGGVTKADFLNAYFDRFQIDPVEYAESRKTTEVSSFCKTGDGSLS